MVLYQSNYVVKKVLFIVLGTSDNLHHLWLAVRRSLNLYFDTILGKMFSIKFCQRRRFRWFSLSCFPAFSRLSLEIHTYLSMSLVKFFPYTTVWFLLLSIDHVPHLLIVVLRWLFRMQRLVIMTKNKMYPVMTSTRRTGSVGNIASNRCKRKL